MEADNIKTVYEQFTNERSFSFYLGSSLSQMEPVAQRQEMVIGTLALLSGLLMVAFEVSRALALKGHEVL